MSNKYFVEDCFYLTPKDVGWNFNRIRKIGTNILERRPDISYWFDNMNEPTCLFLSVGEHEPQKFVWELVEITFGSKEYFYCSCGYRTMKLYLLPNGKEFKCRKCHKLRYQLTAYNRHSVAGESLYKMNRLQKLTYDRTNIGRILYNGKFTKRFDRFLGLCDRAGLDNIVKGANDLKTLINA